MLWRIGLLMTGVSLAISLAAFPTFAPDIWLGIDGMAFDQLTDAGNFWNAAVAALVLLMIIDAERNRGQVRLSAAAGELVRRSLWIGAAVLLLGRVDAGLGLGQVRGAIWNFWQTSSSSQFIKNLIYFVLIFSFAMLRLWVTLLILTYGLKQSYLRTR